jgi:SAM-dependent methyltransferase
MNKNSHADREKIGAYWSGQARDTASRAQTLHWWRSAYLRRCINARICGRPVDGIIQGLIELVKDRLGDRLPFGHGVAVGGGTGAKELRLLEAGIVERVTLYDLSEAFVAEGRASAAARGLQDRIEFVLGDAFAAADEPRYDLVHWNNSLHHMPDVRAAVAWSHHVLRPGGLFLLDDYVGPDRHQWTDNMLAIAAGIRGVFPERYLQNPLRAGALLPTSLHRTPPEEVAANDPSEAPESSQILAAVRDVFPDAFIQATGGVVYHLTLNQMLANFDEDDPQDRLLLDLLMLLDDMSTAVGENHYAVALAIRP